MMIPSRRGRIRTTTAAELPGYLALLQGTYYVITALWSLVDIDSFQRVTGPKTDLWLVKTVGVLVGVIGSALLLAGSRKRRAPEIDLVAGGCAAGLALIDTFYASRGRISRIYLLDALVEIALAAGWIAARRANRPRRRRSLLR